MHILLEFFYTLRIDDRHSLLEMIRVPDIIEVYVYVLLKIRMRKHQYLSLLGGIDETSSNDTSFCKWKEMVLCVAAIVYKRRGCFTVDCRMHKRTMFQQHSIPKSVGSTT
jgi:hypothetical protein